MIRIVLISVVGITAGFALAQDSATQQSPEEERSFFTSLLEDQLSTPNRIIRISGIEGVLSSQATIGQITVADREGVWLRINNASIDWSRSALIFSQRLEISHISAASIEVLRRPLPDEDALPSPEARSFSVPELPIAINLEELEVPAITFGEEAFGLASQLALEGRLKLEAGTLDTELNVNRLDGPGGQLSLTAAYANSTSQLALNVSLSEPENGVLANALNIDGRPPLALTIQGEGPVQNLNVNLALDADGARALAGMAQFREDPEGIGFNVDVGGPISRLIAPQYRAFFGNDTRLQAAGVSRSAGGLLLSSLTVSSEALQLEAAAETAPDGFLTALSLDASIADPQQQRVVLPVAGGDTSVRSARLTATYGEAGTDAWQVALDIDDLDTGTFAARDTRLRLNGQARNLNDAANRNISYLLAGEITGISSDDSNLVQALGDSIRLNSRGHWDAGKPLTLTDLELAAQSFVARLSGDVQNFAFNGNVSLEAQDISAFSGLADRRLGGGLSFTATGELKPITGAFNLTLDGTGSGLRVGNDAANALLRGETRLTGRVARTTEGFEAQNFRVANEQMELEANGSFSTEAADFRFETAITDLGLISERASGRLTANGTARGSASDLKVDLVAEVPEGSVLSRPLTRAKLGFDGRIRDGDLDGSAFGEALLDGKAATLSANIATADETRSMRDILFSAEGARLTGNVTQDATGLLTGELTVDASDISNAAALFLTQAKGAVNANIRLEPQNGEQRASLDGTVRGLELETVSLDSADIQATAADLFGVPAIQGTIRANGLKTAGIDVARLEADASSNGSNTAFNARTSLANGTDIVTSGTLAPEQDGFRLGIDTLTLQQNQIAARLLHPVTINTAGDAITFSLVELDVAGGRIAAEGTLNDRLDVALSMAGVPLSIANAIRADLGMGGTIDGNARIGGTRSAPQITFDLRGRDIRSSALAAAGVSTLAVSANGSTDGNALNLNGEITSPEGVRANVQGSVPLNGSQMDLNIALRSFPLAVLNRHVPNQNLGGTLTGTAKIGGTTSSPTAQFNIQGRGLTALQLTELGIAPLSLEAAGSYVNDRVQLTSLRADGPAGLNLTASGTIPVAGNGLSVSARGTIPLTLGNRLLIDRGTQLSGTATADVQISGSLTSPLINGTLSTRGASVVDPLTNLRLNNVAVDAALSGDTVNLRSATASFARGGTLAVSGTVSTNAASGFPANLSIRLDNARYTDGELVTATVNGAMSISGPLTRDPLLAGNLRIERAEVVVPESLGGGAASIDVRHIDPPAAVVQTLQRARAEDGTPMPGSRPSVMRLDLTVDAPARIFIRGRGLDAEVGGSVRLTGPITSVEPVGGFRLIRGRLSILGQRIVLSEGTVTLTGDLDPDLNFIATSEANGTHIIITVRGRVSNLSVNFSSEPALPEDEVLSQLIFNRSIDQLSPIQLAQLAVAASELAGGNTSLLGSLRSATGLDELDVTTDAEGNFGVRAGRYIQENIYLGVETGAKGDAKATINLDVTEHLRLRGSTGTDGDTGGGIFYEKDY